MKKTFIGIFILSLMILAFPSCQKENSLTTTSKTENQLTPQQVKQVALMKEVALATGKAMKNSAVKNYLVELVKVKNDNSEAISLAALLGDNAHTTQYEKTLLNKGFAKDLKSAPVNKSLFAKAFLSAVSSNPNKYPILTKSLPHLKSSNSIGDELDSLKQVLAKQNLEIYLPYRQEFNWDSVSQVTVTWDPLTEDTLSNGEMMPLNNLKMAPAQPVNNIDEKYVAYNPTVLIRPIDPADYTNGSSGSGTGSLEPTSKWLTTNIDYTKVQEADIVLVTIPKVALTHSYRGWLGGSSLIQIWRVSGNLEFGSSGDLIPSSSQFDLKQMKISHYDAKYGIWVAANIIWDDDWQEHENAEQFVLISKQRWPSLASVDLKGTVKIGWDPTKKQVSYSSTETASFEIKEANRHKLRYNNQVSRRSLLAHVVGGILHDKNGNLIVHNVNGVPYTVRSADALYYYFRVNWTHVAN